MKNQTVKGSDTTKKIIIIGLVLLILIATIGVIGKGKPAREDITIEVSRMVTPEGEGFSSGPVTYVAPYRKGESFDGKRWIVLVDSPQLQFLIDGEWVDGVIDTMQRTEETYRFDRGRHQTYTKWAVGINTDAGRFSICQCDIRDLITHYDEDTETWYVEYTDACIRDYFDGSLVGTVSFSFTVSKVSIA